MAPNALMAPQSDLPIELIAIRELHPHPRNYRTHPPDQLEHIQQSIREHGLYRNVVIARENTILAGHGVVKACQEMQIEQIPVIRLPIDPDSPQALKLLTGDNEIGHLAEVDDRMFIEILKEVRDLGELRGTGYDEMMLSNLIYTVSGESQDRDASDDIWKESGMPADQNGERPFKLIVWFRTEDDRQSFCEQSGLEIAKKEASAWVTWWPYREHEDSSALKFESATP